MAMDRVTWFELPADDVARAAKFYQEAFGWSSADIGGGSVVLQSGPVDESMNPTEPGSINGDISPRSEVFDRPLVVIQTDDLATKIEAITNAGGHIALEPQEMTEMGMLWSIVVDTEGNKVGLVQMI